ncbi:MAG: HEAT repeat domain-containing protein [Planctomycetota bacterium]
MRHVGSGDAQVESAAWALRLATAQDDEIEAVLLEALGHRFYSVRRAACHRTCQLTDVSATLKNALRDRIANDDNAVVFEAACVALGTVDPGAGVDHVSAQVAARGDGFLDWALPALSTAPPPALESYFRATLEGSADSDRRILAARSLLQLGDTSQGVRVAAEWRTDSEFSRLVGEGESRRGLMVSTYQTMIEDLRGAQVVVFGELHANGQIMAAESYIACEVTMYQGDRETCFAYEAPVMEYQRQVVTCAETQGWTVTSLEDESPEPLGGHERDTMVKARLLGLVEKSPDSRWFVVYGNAHRSSIVDHLVKHGVSARGVSLVAAGSALPMVVKSADTLNIRGACFHDGDRMWCMPTLPWGLCPEVDRIIAGFPRPGS